VEFTDSPRGQKTAAEDYVAQVSTRPTRTGLTYPVTQLGDTEQATSAKWDIMPAVTTVNPIHAVKPGATVLLTGKTSDRQEQVVLAYQRYGRGKSLAFPIQDSWVWKMDATMAVEDTTHAMFWR